MELCVFISNINYIENFDEVFTTIQKPGSDFLEILDSDKKVNQTSLTKLTKYFNLKDSSFQKDLVERLYFGAETCEYLVPGLDEIETAYNFCCEKEIGFTLVTPYGGTKLMAKIRDIFNFLSDKDDVEVVVNDFGVLQLLLTEFKTLKPLIGRLLIKIKRDPRFSVSGYDIANTNIKNKSRVEKNQSNSLQNSSFDNELLQSLLIENGVARLNVDAVPQGLDKKALKNWKLPVDLFWPWTYITSGRNCAIAAHTDKSRSYHHVEKPCAKQCKIYEFRFESDKQMDFSVQRGNAIWMNSEPLFESYINLGFDRIVYQPYIPIG